MSETKVLESDKPKYENEIKKIKFDLAKRFSDRKEYKIYFFESVHVDHNYKLNIKFSFKPGICIEYELSLNDDLTEIEVVRSIIIDRQEYDLSVMASNLGSDTFNLYTNELHKLYSRIQSDICALTPAINLRRRLGGYRVLK